MTNEDVLKAIGGEIAANAYLGLPRKHVVRKALGAGRHSRRRGQETCAERCEGGLKDR